MIDLPQFAPDLANSVFDNLSVSSIVENLLPHATGYESVKSFETMSDMCIEGEVRGSISFQRPNFQSLVINIIGTTKGLYRFSFNRNDTFKAINISRDGGYNIKDESSWSFTSFGEYVVAVNPNYPVQYLNLNKSNSKFIDLKDAPRADKVSTWGNYLALINVLDHDSENRDMVAWSGLNNLEDWNFTDRASDADQQRLYDGGMVLNATSGNNPYIFLREKIYRAMFVPSSDLVFNIQAVNFDGGLKVDHSLIEANDRVFFYSDLGFFCIFPDGSIRNIGKDRVNNFIYDTVDIIDDGRNLKGFFFNGENRVYWSIKRSYKNNSYDFLLVYDYLLDRWSTINVSFEHLISYSSSGFTLEGLDMVDNLDKLAISLDSRVWQEGEHCLAIVTTDGHLAVRAGNAMEARISTNIISDNENGYILLDNLMLATSHIYYKVDINHGYDYSNLNFREPTAFPSRLMNNVRCIKRDRFFRVIFTIYNTKKVERFYVNRFSYRVQRAGIM